jgi:hypothetical protein
MSKLKAVVSFYCPQVAEFARRSDGVLFARWYESKGRYGYGWTAWRLANAQEQSACVGDPEFFRYGFTTTFTRTTEPAFISRLRLPQPKAESNV